jgi:hypothetical protein
MISLTKCPLPRKVGPLLQIPPNFVGCKDDFRTELKPVTIREVYNILKRTQVNTAGGCNGFRYTPIIRLHETPPQILPDLHNAMFKYSTHPVE